MPAKASKLHKEQHLGYDVVAGGLFGALALVLPILFHLIGVGPFLLPMFLPIAALACLVSWQVVLSVAILVPIVSFLLTSMPPIVPPLLPIVIVELFVLSGTIYVLYQIRRNNIYVTLIIAAVINRLLLFGILFLLEKVFLVVSGLFSAAIVIEGIPGFLLQLVVIPPLVKYLEPRISEVRKWQ